MWNNSILAIIAYNTSKENSSWCFTKYSYLKKIVFCTCQLQTKFVLIHQRRFQHADNSILAITAYNTLKENSFWFITQCTNMQNRKQYSSNHCIQYFKRKFVLMHHTMHQHAENCTLRDEQIICVTSDSLLL